MKVLEAARGGGSGRTFEALGIEVLQHRLVEVLLLQVLDEVVLILYLQSGVGAEVRGMGCLRNPGLLGVAPDGENRTAWQAATVQGQDQTAFSFVDCGRWPGKPTTPVSRAALAIGTLAPIRLPYLLDLHAPLPEVPEHRAHHVSRC